MGIMEKKMETTIMRYIGLKWYAAPLLRKFCGGSTGHGLRSKGIGNPRLFSGLLLRNLDEVTIMGTN